MLDERSLQELAESGLDEIRFSIKPPDAGDGQDRVYELMEQAVGTNPAVVVALYFCLSLKVCSVCFLCLLFP